MLPPPLDAYFEAVSAHDAGRIAACFAPDAIVRDEHESKVGREAIRAAWADETGRRYRHTAEPLSVAAGADRAIVTARVAGDFAGSPIELRYVFTLAGGLVRGLEIG